MKHTIKLTLIALLLFSCGGKEQSVDEVIATQNLEIIRQKKAALDQDYNALGAQIDQLSKTIKALDPQEKIPLVTTFTVKDTLFHHYVEILGNVTTKENIIIYPEYQGVLSKVLVTEGQKVKMGQVLAKIDDGGLSQQLAQLQIQADLAKTTYQRQKRLWEQNIGSEIQYLQTKTNYEAQKKGIEDLKKRLDKSLVKAPFSGTIDDVLTDQGTVVGAQSQLFRLVSLNNMYIESDVPERYVPSIIANKNVEAFFPVLGKTIKSKVRQAGNYINPANRTFKVEVSLPKNRKDIKPNLSARLKINDYTNPKAILIPLSIISEDAKGQQYVYTIQDKTNQTTKAKRTFITTGKTQGDDIEVLTGLNTNTKIINKGARSVNDGQVVRVIDTGN